MHPCLHHIFIHICFWTATGPMNLGLSVPPSVRSLHLFFSQITTLGIFLILYMAMGPYENPFQGKIQIWPIMTENGQKQLKITSKILVLKLWPNQIALLLFQTLAKTICNFCNFYMMIVEMILYHHIQVSCPGKF